MVRWSSTKLWSPPQPRFSCAGPPSDLPAVPVVLLACCSPFLVVSPFRLAWSLSLMAASLWSWCVHCFGGVPLHVPIPALGMGPVLRPPPLTARWRFDAPGALPGSSTSGSDVYFVVLLLYIPCGLGDFASLETYSCTVFRLFSTTWALLHPHLPDLWG